MNRFAFLLRSLRMDDKEGREEAKKRDKFAAAREIMDKFNLQLAKHLQCGTWIVQDETLYPYRGSGFGFRIYIKNKPWKFGILYRSLNDSEIPYTYVIHPCAGKPEGEPTEHYIRSAADILVSNLEKYAEAGHELRGRNLTMDRGYTSYDVVRRVENQFRMTSIGTIQANRKGLPKDIVSTTDRPVGDYRVLYDEGSKISIHSEVCASKSGTKKNVLILTNMIPDLARTRDQTSKAYLTNLYNYTMGGRLQICTGTGTYYYRS